jgi:hypothetical protein
MSRPSAARKQASAKLEPMEKLPAWAGPVPISSRQPAERSNAFIEASFV